MVFFVFLLLGTFYVSESATVVENCTIDTSSLIHEEKNAHAVKHGNLEFQLPAHCNISKSIIVMSEGRSGSSYICDIISANLDPHHHPRITTEILGSNDGQMKALSFPLKTIENQLCPSTAGNSSPYRGFKWKPVYWGDAYLEALQWVAYHRIPVVYNTRNPIDTFMSALKHQHEANGHLRAHCKAGDSACVSMHLGDQRQHVDPSQLLENVTQTTCRHTGVRSLLKEMHVRHLVVSYEELSADHADNATLVRAWRDVFEFIDSVTPWGRRITPGSLKASIVATSSIHHRDKIENYDEVEAALRGTPFAGLLN